MAGGAIRLTWKKAVPYEDRWGVEIWDNDRKVGAAPAGAETWTHTGFDPAVMHVYKVRQLGPGNIVSPFSAVSNSVFVLSAPGTPGALSPAGAVVPLGECVLEWVHASQDTTEQTRAEVRYRLRGSQAWTTKTVTSNTPQIFAPTLGVGLYEWQVRTWGLYKPGEESGASPWSAVTGFQIAARPVVAIQTPQTTIGTSVLKVTWSYSQEEGSAQTLARVQITDQTAGQLVADKTLPGAGTSYTMEGRAVNGHEYTIVVTANSGHGLESAPASRRTVVRYAPPEEPKVNLVWDETAGAVTIGIENPPAKPGKTVATVSNMVEHSLDGGQTWEVIADNLPVNTTLQDREALTGGESVYRVTASSVTPSSASTTRNVTVRSRKVWISGGPGFGLCVGLQ